MVVQPESGNPPDRGERILHYHLRRPLGVGGMGEVYLAEDERLGRRVALKFLSRADTADSERRERLRREARALASLSHPGIATVHALEEHGDRLFLVMEYVAGETLGERIAKRPLPIPEVMERGLTLAEALAHAHARGVIHRDIKPSNVLIPPEGGTKLADFGLALTEGETRLTAEGVSAGTADHMSPEQTRGEALDARSDLFSLGVVLYESLTGVRPFARPTIEATFHAVRSEEPEPPSALRSGVPLELERIVMKLLRKTPAERYPSASDLAADLRALRSRVGAAAPAPAQGPDTATATQVSDASRQVAPPRRSRLRRRLLSAAAALAILAALIFVIRDRMGPGAGTAEAAPRSIAVLSFQDMADPADARGEAAMATNLLTVGLGQSRVVPVLSNQRVHDVLKRMGKTERTVTGEDAIEAGRRAGASYIVVGYIYQTAPRYVVGAEVSSTTNGAVLTSTRAEAGGEQGMFAAIDSLTAALERGLSTAGVELRSGPVDVAELTTRNPAAYRAYLRGIDFLYRADYDQAARALGEAVRADSTFALAWYYDAVATWWNEDFRGAAGIVNTAMRLGSRLQGRERESLRALQLLVSAHYAEAAREYRALLRRYPDEKEFLYGLGEGLYHDGHDIPGARAAFGRTVELDPGFAVAYQHIFDIDVLGGDAGAVVSDAERFQRANPADSYPTVLKMRSLADLGDGNASVATAREILARDPGNQDAIYQLAIFHRMTGQFDSAAVYQHALDPSRVQGIQARTGDVWIAICGGRYREADRRSSELIRGFEIRDSRTDLAIPTTRVIVLLELGRLEEAWALAQKVGRALQDLSPNGGQGLDWYGEMALRTGHLDVARAILADYDRILRVNNSMSERQNRLYLAGLIALAQGHARDAVTYEEAGRTEGPITLGFQRTDWARARAYVAAGEHAKAFATLKRVVSRSPVVGIPDDAFTAMILLAKEYEARGQPDQALALYRRVIYQYRFADSRVPSNEEAKAAIARLQQARAQSAANR